MWMSKAEVQTDRLGIPGNGGAAVAVPLFVHLHPSFLCCSSHTPVPPTASPVVSTASSL